MCAIEPSLGHISTETATLHTVYVVHLQVIQRLQTLLFDVSTHLVHRISEAIATANTIMRNTISNDRGTAIDAAVLN